MTRKLHAGTIRDYDDTMERVGRAVGGDMPQRRGSATPRPPPWTRGCAAGDPDRRLKHVTGDIRAFVRWCNRRLIPCGWTLDTFAPPTKAERRRDRAKRMKRPYTAAQVRRLLRHAGDRMRMAILLGLNAAMGPEELLLLRNADVKGGVIDKPREKTGVARRVPLWPETIEAIAAAGGRGLLFAGAGGRRDEADHADAEVPERVRPGVRPADGRLHAAAARSARSRTTTATTGPPRS